ncbi:hypothetical protein C3L33_05379, partial [Rhododendron williamsianum]
MAFKSNEEVALQVRSIPLDELIPESEPVLLLKIDVQGWEYHVLKGASKLLSRKKGEAPYIIYEEDERLLKASNSSAKEIREFLQTVGYHNCTQHGTDAHFASQSSYLASKSFKFLKGNGQLTLFHTPYLHQNPFPTSSKKTFLFLDIASLFKWVFLVVGLIAGNSTARKVIWINDTTRNCKTVKFQSFQAKAADGDKSTTKMKSIVCADCDGNGALLCPECQGAGVNPEDKRNGQFKAGGLCWLCR